MSTTTTTTTSIFLLQVILIILAEVDAAPQDLGSPIRIAQCRALCLDKVRKLKIKREPHAELLYSSLVGGERGKEEEEKGLKLVAVIISPPPDITC